MSISIFHSVSFMKKVKKGHLAEHLPMINGINIVSNWDNVKNETVKMYKAEVMDKVPIIIHVAFLVWITYFISFECSLRNCP